MPGDFITALIAESMLAKHPGETILYDLRASRAVPDTVERMGGTAIAICADVSKQAAAKELMTTAAREYGRLDYLINNAGWSTRIPHVQMDDLTDEVWDKTFNTNLRGAFYCVRAAAPLLKQQPGAAIVNIASVSGIR